MLTTIETKNEAPVYDDLTTNCLATPFAEWHPNVMAAFVDRIEDAFGEKLKGPMVQAEEALGALLHHVMSSAPAEIGEAVLGVNGDPRIRAAYLLGQLSFAQQFAATVAGHRPDDEFFEEFKNEQTKKVLACLTAADSTKAEISAGAGLALATLNSKLRTLTGLGITEFRARFGNGEPGVAEYFLTPAAKQMLAEQAKA